METYVAESTKEGKDPNIPRQAIAHVLPKLTFLRNVGPQSTEMCSYCRGCCAVTAVVLLLHLCSSKLKFES